MMMVLSMSYFNWILPQNDTIAWNAECLKFLIGTENVWNSMIIYFIFFLSKSGL